MSSNMLGNAWEKSTDIKGTIGQRSLSSIDDWFGRSDPRIIGPTAKQLPLEGSSDGGGGVVVKFFSQFGTPRSVVTVDFVCDDNSTGLEHLRRTDCNPDGVKGNKDSGNNETDRNDAPYQTSSLRFLNWTMDSQLHHLHLEWKTVLVCDRHVLKVSKDEGGQHARQRQQSLVNILMQPWEQLRLGL